MACVSSASKNADAARSLIKFLTAPAAAPVFKAKDTLRLRLTAAKLRTSRRVWTRNRGGSVSMRVIARPILPISLCAPVAVTSARPCPRTTMLPE
jgi:hypothetical protein